MRILAGTTVEGLQDGPAADGWLAQPSGLAVDGDRLWFVDSETSALRYLTVGRPAAHRRRRGPVRLRSCGRPGARRPGCSTRSAWRCCPTVRSAIADTYNGAIRRYDPVADEVSTLASDLAEPSGLLEVDGAAAGDRIGRAPAGPAGAAGGCGQRSRPLRTERPVTLLRPGRLTLRTAFVVPPGRKLDDRYGPSTRLLISPSALLAAGDGDGTELERVIELVGAPGEEAVLQVTAQAASCDVEAENPACYLARQDWGVPIRLDPEGETELTLMLLG